MSLLLRLQLQVMLLLPLLLRVTVTLLLLLRQVLQALLLLLLVVVLALAVALVVMHRSRGRNLLVGRAFSYAVASGPVQPGARLRQSGAAPHGTVCALPQKLLKGKVIVKGWCGVRQNARVLGHGWGPLNTSPGLGPPTPLPWHTLCTPLTREYHKAGRTAR